MAYGAYGDLTPNKLGLVFGLESNVESKLVATGVTIAFGEPVFVKTGDDECAYLPDSTDATRKFLGIAPISHRSYVSSDGGQYNAFDTVNVLTEGQIWVALATGVTACANKPAYIVDLTSDGQYKKFTDVSTDNYDTGCYFRSNPLNGMAILEVRGLK